MNILHITGMLFPTKYGSLEQWFTEICKQARIKGYKVYIAYTQQVDNVTLYSEIINEHGGQLIVLNGDYEVELFCKNHNINIVHFHFGFCGYKPLYRRLYKQGCHLFVHYHCENFYYVNNKWQKNIFTRLRIYGHRVKTQYAALYIEQFFGCSKTIAEQYKSFYRFPNKKVSVLYLGIQHDEDSECAEESSISTITCTAFHSPIKGVDVLLEALALLKKNHIPFRLVQIGGGSSELSGEDTQELKTQCYRLGLNDDVLWTGVINNVKDYLKKTDIYCQPSRSEAISLSIAEAMQYGIPVVASDVGGIPELVHDGENGYLVPSDNPMVLAEKLYYLIKDKEMRKTFGKKSSEILEQLDFYQEKSVNKLLSIYETYN